MTTSDTRVLLVDDDPQILNVYEDMLENTYSLLSATDGQTALDQLDETIDVVLLDRRMPEMQGDEVLMEIRNRGFDCPVVMVTAVEPAIDIITMPFNDYLTKPVTAAELSETIERMRSLSKRDIQVQEYFALVAKRDTLDARGSTESSTDHDAYDDLVDRIENLHDRVDPPIEPFEEQLAEQLSKSRPDKAEDDHWMQTLFG